MPGDRIVDIPPHSECGLRGEIDTTDVNGSPAATRIEGECVNKTYLLERVVQVEKGKLLWIQVRAKDRGTAFDVANAFSYTTTDAR